MVPTTIGAGLHHVRVELVGSTTELSEVGLGGHAAAMGRQARPEDIGHEDELDLLTDRTRDRALDADVLGCPDQLGVGIAQLISPESPAAVLVDQSAAFQTVVHHGARFLSDNCTTTAAA